MSSAISLASTIPGAFRELPQWIVWRGEDRRDKKTGAVTGLNKIPYTLHERKASTTEPKDWTTFKRAAAALPVLLEEWEAANPDQFRGGGLGFVFAPNDPFCGIDLDHCLTEDGVIEEWAAMILEWIPSYAERTPSGTGLHILTRATLPGGKGKKQQHIECYDRERFFTMTGDWWPGTPHDIQDGQEGVERLLAWLGEQKEAEQRKKRPPKSAQVAPMMALSDDALLTKAIQAKNGHVFLALWNGDTGAHGGDSSAADCALASHLAFWAGGDPGQIDRLFRQSGLMRDKWDEQHGELSYGQRTIAFVLQHATTPTRAVPMMSPIAVASHASSPPVEWPPDASEDPGPLTHVEIIPSFPHQAQPPRAAPLDISWRQSLILNDKKGTPQETLHNIMLFLEHLEAFEGLWWDTFRGVPMLGQLVLTEEHILRMISQMSQLTKMSINNFRNFTRCVHAVCHQKEIDPLHDFLTNLPPWDQQPRIETFFMAYAGSPDTLFTRWVGRSFWCQLASRIRAPGSQARLVVILHGQENTGKSMLCRAIGHPWASTLEQGLDHKEAQMLLRGVLVMELPELGSFSKTEERHIKSFISLTEDAYVPKYSNDRLVIPRRAVFIGTTNERACLPSVTGNTRFNPVDTSIVRHEECARDRDQLLAEAVEYVKRGYEWWKEPPGIGAAEERDDRRVINVYEEPLREWLATDAVGERIITWPLLAERFLGLDNKERWKDKALQMQILAALRALGYERRTHTGTDRNGMRTTYKGWTRTTTHVQ